MISEAGADAGPRNGIWLALAVQATSTSAAIGNRDGVLQQVRDDDVADRLAAAPSAPPASRAALAVVAECLRRSDLALDDLAGLCVSNGPGAFTALRVAIGIIQGIGLATGLPVVGVPTLAALAMAAGAADAQATVIGGAAGAAAGRRMVLTAIDARMKECYFAAWVIDPGERAPGSRMSAPPRELEAAPGLAGGRVGSGEVARDAFLGVIAAYGQASDRLILAGSGFASEPILRQWMPPASPGPAAQRMPDLEVDAAAVLAAALADGAGPGVWPSLPARALRPRYVRDKVALDVDEQRALIARRDASSSRS